MLFLLKSMLPLVMLEMSGSVGSVNPCTFPWYKSCAWSASVLSAVFAELGTVFPFIVIGNVALALPMANKKIRKKRKGFIPFPLCCFWYEYRHPAHC